MEKFKELFEKYDFVVEEFGENSFIATNGKISIPYTENNRFGYPEMSGVSLLATPKEIKEFFKDEKFIGYRAFSLYMNDRLPFNRTHGICNHDLSLWEVEWWLKKFAKKNGQV